MRTALITGGTGLIGRHVLENWDVDELTPVVADRGEFDLLAPGVGAELIRRLRPEVVVHLAWSAGGRADYRTSADNAAWVKTSVDLHKACVEAGSHFIATGSAVDKENFGADSYTRSKRQLWRAMRPAVLRKQMTWLRPFYVFDPPSRRPAVIDQAIAAVQAGTPITLQNPFSHHDFVHAADVASAISLVVKHRLAGEVSIGSGRLYRVCDVVTALGGTWTGADTSPEQPTHHNSSADIDRLTTLGWSPAWTSAFFAVNRRAATPNVDPRFATRATPRLSA